MGRFRLATIVTLRLFYSPALEDNTHSIRAFKNWLLLYKKQLKALFIPLVCAPVAPGCEDDSLQKLCFHVSPMRQPPVTGSGHKGFPQKRSKLHNG